MSSPLDPNLPRFVARKNANNSVQSSESQKVSHQSSIRGRIKRCLNSLKKPQTFMLAGATMVAAGGVIASTGAFAPVMLPVGAVVAGTGVILGVVGLAMKAYQSRNKHSSETENKPKSNFVAADLSAENGAPPFVKTHRVNPLVLSKFNELAKNDINKLAKKTVTTKLDLKRFDKVIENNINTACKEIQKGQKTGHWMWFIFPQIAGLGASQKNKEFAISHADEAMAFMMNNKCRSAYDKAVSSLFVSGKSAEEILGHTDAAKLFSSLTLFFKVTGNPLYKNALDVFFQGRLDANTIGILDAQKELNNKQSRDYDTAVSQIFPPISQASSLGGRSEYTAQNKDGSMHHLQGLQHAEYAKAIEPIRAPFVQQLPAGRRFSLAHVNVDERNIIEADQEIVVNAANRRLRGGGGIDKAIHQRAGSNLMKELAARYPQDAVGNACKFAEPCASHSHGFKEQGVSYLIHVTGPIVGDNENSYDKKMLLQEAYKNTLDKAVALGAKSISLPILSSGVYGYPMSLACIHALEVCGRSEYQHLGISFYTWKNGQFGSAAYDSMTAALDMMKNQ